MGSILLVSSSLVVLRVMLVLQAARSSSTLMVVGVRTVVVPSPVRIQPKWTDPLLTFADKWRSPLSRVDWQHVAWFSFLMQLELPSHFLSSWNAMVPRRTVLQLMTSPMYSRLSLIADLAQLQLLWPFGSQSIRRLLLIATLGVNLTQRMAS